MPHGGGHGLGKETGERGDKTRKGLNSLLRQGPVGAWDPCLDGMKRVS